MGQQKRGAIVPLQGELDDLSGAIAYATGAEFFAVGLRMHCVTGDIR